MIEPVAARALIPVLVSLYLFGRSGRRWRMLIATAIVTVVGALIAGVLAAWIAPARRDPVMVESPRSRDRAA